MCPLRKGEAAEAVAAIARRAKIPPEEVLAPPALRSLVAAAARCGEVRFAVKLYRTPALRDALRPSRFTDHRSGNADDGGARREVFEALVEACCHDGDINTALEIFDEVKALEISVSKVTLAFLESCCRRYKVPDYRVYDVCAQMRMQVSNKRAASLPVPLKTSSHHVRGAVESDDLDDDDDDEGRGVGGDVEAGGGAIGDASSGGVVDDSGGSSAAASAAAAVKGRGLEGLAALARKGGGGGGGERRRAKSTEDAWERARRERSRDIAAAAKSDFSEGGGGSDPDLAWLKPGMGDRYDYYGEFHDGDGDGDDLIAAELRTEGLGRGNGGK